MSEYIVNVSDEEAELFIARFGIGGTTLFGHQLIGEIVRCRDCKHYAEWDEYHPTNPWTCRWCKFWDDQTKIDGFCHAGERKVDA